jgi:polyisoprenoid-binding protein YceI
VPRYRFVPEQSKVWIEARTAFHPIAASADGLVGHIDVVVDQGRLDLDGVPAGRLSLDVTRLSSGNRLEDREMQRRIDARRYPTIDGVLTAMEPAGDDDCCYRMSGTITFRGVTRSYNDVMTVQVADPRTLCLEGGSRFDIRDFGMEPPRIVLMKVEPEVDLRVEIVARCTAAEIAAVAGTRGDAGTTTTVGD